ncbi:MAG: sulfatase [Verrucomicrobiaceae bacterium]|nr:sulfatase [Verrucomicrobiaceae bacterium]
MTFGLVAASPNVVIIFCDDLGYADIGPFGAKGYSTPHLDRMAAEGTKFTNFHVSQPVCSASRASLLTGCYSNRLGIHGALGPSARHGIANEEVTIAEVMKQKGYVTCAVGKWHLGHHAKFLPTRHGFDEYFGLPYSNDMWPFHPEAKPGTYPKLPLIDGEKVVDEDVTPEDQTQLTTRYTERAVDFIRRMSDKPFFLYLAHSMCHVPLYVSEKFAGKSERGLFGDVLMEIDWSVGEVLKALSDAGVEKDTLVVFTSDNGPWLSYGLHAGSAEPFREGKGTCWEGGVRVPCVMKMPGRIKAGHSSDAMLMTIDLLPTLAALVGADLPKQKIDGANVWPLLTGESGAANPQRFYAHWYENNQLQAVTSGDGRWKLQLPHRYRSMGTQPKVPGPKPGKYEQVKIDQAELYDLKNDVSESTNVADKHPDVLARLQGYAEEARKALGDSLTKTQGGENRLAGQL